MTVADQTTVTGLVKVELLIIDLGSIDNNQGNLGLNKLNDLVDNLLNELSKFIGINKFDNIDNKIDSNLGNIDNSNMGNISGNIGNIGGNIGSIDNL